MSETFRTADKVSLPVPAGTTAGSPIRVGTLNGITATDRADTSVPPVNPDGTLNPAYNQGGGNPDGCATVWLAGGFDLPVVSAEGVDVGDLVYFDEGTGKLTALPGKEAPWGIALTAGTNNSDGTYQTIVRLAQVRPDPDVEA